MFDQGSVFVRLACDEIREYMARELDLSITCNIYVGAVSTSEYPFLCLDIQIPAALLICLCTTAWLLCSSFYKHIAKKRKKKCRPLQETPSMWRRISPSRLLSISTSRKRPTEMSLRQHQYLEMIQSPRRRLRLQKQSRLHPHELSLAGNGQLSSSPF